MQGHKHLIKCRCVLPQYKALEKPPAHKFIVFSVIDDSGNVVPKFSQCNNCGLIHKVVDICTSEIQSGKDSMKSLIKIEDIKPSLHPNFSGILESNNCDLPTWEAVQFYIENKLWGSFVILTKEAEGDEVHGKFLRILGESFCKVESFTRTEATS